MTSKQQRALALTAGLAATPKAIDRIGAKAGVEEARWAFTQWELRRKGRKKFERALEMLFDRDGLEMATHERIAAYHASRFEPGELVGDLTVGVGADLVALAKRGPTVGYEISKERRACARHNLLVEGLEAEIWDADCFQPGWNFDAAFADPARRRKGVRQVSPEQFERRASSSQLHRPRDRGNGSVPARQNIRDVPTCIALTLGTLLLFHWSTHQAQRLEAFAGG